LIKVINTFTSTDTTLQLNLIEALTKMQTRYYYITCLRTI